MRSQSSRLCCVMRAAVVAVLVGAAAGQAQTTFTNATNLRVPAVGTGPGPASVYPSTIAVSGLTQPVDDVRVTITGLSHTFPADIDILLVGPTGQSVLLMANTGGTCDVTDVTLNFSDGAQPLPSGCISTGVYSPTGSSTPEFPAPAPAAPFANSLSTFSGTNGNGTWNLYVFDDSALDSGAIAGGWSLTFSQPSITYQGRLDRDSTPVTGAADFIFSVFASPTGGPALGTVARNNVAVQGGLFTVELPFNSSLFDGSARWMEVQVRSPAGAGPFSLLSGRQPMDAAPMAVHARTAGFATASLTSSNATRAEHATTASNAIQAANASTANVADLATAANRLDAPDGSPTGAVFVTNTGQIGIPAAVASNRFTVIGDTLLQGGVAIGPSITSAQSLLHISNAPSLATEQPGAQVLVEGQGFCYINMLARDSGEHGLTFGSPASNIHGGIYYTNSLGMDFRTGNNLSRMTINAVGNVGIGVGVSGGSVDAKLHVSNAGRVAKFDRVGSDGELVAFARDDGVIGNITVVNGVVSYNAFTGSHWAWMDHAPERGMLVSMTGDNHRAGTTPGEGEVIYGARLTTVANDPACLGAYLAPMESMPSGAPEGSGGCHQIMAVGNGEMWVTQTSRDIRPGDCLIASDTPGCAMLDDPARFPIGNVMARSAGVVRWNEVTPDADGIKRARVSVLFDSFVRSSEAGDAQLRTRIKALESQNEELSKRLERLERAVQGK